MTPDELIAQYWEAPQTPAPEIAVPPGSDDSPIRKKLILVKHFATELKKRAGEARVPPLRIALPTDSIAHVKYWARTQEGVLFRMVNRDLQANFADHTKLWIEAESRAMLYDTGHGITRLTMDELNDRVNFHDARKKVALMRDMARRLG
jgi:hypothetical protein